MDLFFLRADLSFSRLGLFFSKVGLFLSERVGLFFSRVGLFFSRVGGSVLLKCGSALAVQKCSKHDRIYLKNPQKFSPAAGSSVCNTVQLPGKVKALE